MDKSGKRIPASWSFVGGTLIGALAAIALPASIHGARSAAGSQTAAAVTSEVRTAPNAAVAAWARIFSPPSGRLES